MSVVSLTLAIAGAATLAAATRVVQLVVSERSGELRAVRRALVGHGVAWLVFVGIFLIADPLGLPLAVTLVAGFMAVSWGVAWLYIGLTYGLGADAEASSRVAEWETAPGRFERWARRSAGAPSPPRR